MLELGPGTGYYSLEVAATLDGGALDLFDISQEFLDDVLRQAADRGTDNIMATQGDARALPFAQDSFDAGFMVAVLASREGGLYARAPPRRPARVLRKLPGALATAGVSVATTPGARSPVAPPVARHVRLDGRAILMA